MYSGLRFFQDYTNIPLDKSRIQTIIVLFLNKLQTNFHINYPIPSVILIPRESLIFLDLNFLSIEENKTKVLL